MKFAEFHLIALLLFSTGNLSAERSHLAPPNGSVESRRTGTHTVILPSTKKSISVTCQKWNTIKALDIKKEWDQANKTDLRNLWLEFRKIFAKMSDEDRKKTVNSLQGKLKADLKSLQLVKTSSAFHQQEIDFTSSVGKLIGDGTPSNKGILNEALAHVADWQKTPSVLDTEPNTFIKLDHDLTVLKTVLIYANLAVKPTAKIAKLIEATDPQLLYPAKLAMPGKKAIESNPSCKVFKDALGKTCLYCSDGSFNGCFMVPNAGYVYGAKLPKDECYGTDCSAFVSECIDSRTRHTTLSLQNIAQELSKAGAASERENTKNKKLIADSDFKVLDPKTSPLEEGDIIVWRGKGMAHVVFFLKWQDQKKKEFIAIEAARQSSKEGVVIDQYELFHRGVTPSVLRPKEKKIKSSEL